MRSSLETHRVVYPFDRNSGLSLQILARIEAEREAASLPWGTKPLFSPVVRRKELNLHGVAPSTRCPRGYGQPGVANCGVSQRPSHTWADGGYGW
jgi:hypothetical protein